MRFGFSGHLRTDGPIDHIPRGLENVCLLHSGGGYREAATYNESHDPRCVCRVKCGRRLQIEAVQEAAEDLTEIARRLRAIGRAR
jgi:hypothetical protein